VTGTFDKATGFDSIGLCWHPRRRNDVAQIISHLSDFFDWLEEEKHINLGLNPEIKASVFDRHIRTLANNYARSKSFLGHLWQNPSQEKRRFVRIPPLPNVQLSEPPAFPEDRFISLITYGFKPNTPTGLRDILITLLLNCAGFRVSEPFHLYVTDVVRDPTTDSAIVRIHHPIEGNAPEDWFDERGNVRRGNRAAYLAERWGMTPRSSSYDSLHSGWKGGSHDGKYYKEAYWFPPSAGRLFMDAWTAYMLVIASIERNHPFAFINLTRGHIGEPYKLSQYHKAHKIACTRIGLTHIKSDGTTPHGHRHAYGRRLSMGNVDELFIKRFMHHSSIESQKVYTQPSSSEIATIVSQAIKTLSTTGNDKIIKEIDDLYINSII
jgi:site-specific recombinase XerD